MPRCLITLTLLVLSFPCFSHAQSLGEVAREARAEKQASGSEQPKVITNEDIVKPVPTQERDITKEGVEKIPEVVGTEHPKRSSNEDLRAHELERQRRTNEINQRYMVRIATLRDQIKAMESQVEKLRASYEPTDNDYYAYEALVFNQHVDDLIKEQCKLIASLKSQLAATQEEARHAGVPHATD